jgi:FMN-dependent NADH-azoreductase
MNLLHLDSSILGGNSISRSLSAAAVAKLTASTPGIHVTYRDLAAEPIPHLSGEYLGAAQSGPEAQHIPSLQADLALGSAVMEEFLAADVIVVGVGLYNFGVPSQLKAWVDRILVAGKTFRYTATGVEGLAGNKRVIITIARGGVYKEGSPAAGFEHGESYLRVIFGFVGITDIEVVVAEGVAMGPEPREAAIKSAETAIAGLKAA